MMALVTALRTLNRARKYRNRTWRSGQDADTLTARTFTHNRTLLKSLRHKPTVLWTLLAATHLLVAREWEEEFGFTPKEGNCTNVRLDKAGELKGTCFTLPVPVTKGRPLLTCEELSWKEWVPILSLIRLYIAPQTLLPSQPLPSSILMAKA